MGGWAETCESCGEVNYAGDMSKIDGEFYCEACAEEVEEEIEEEIAEAEAGGELHRCGVCGLKKSASKMVERMRGWLCFECSHPQEVGLLGYCDLGCTLCKSHPEWADVYPLPSQEASRET